MRARVKLTAIILAAVVLWGGVLLATATAQRVPAADYDVKVRAAQTMQSCMDAVKAHKLANGIAIHELDIRQTGMIGTDFNAITTTLGEIGSKRTTADSNMAALVVQMLTEAGVREGDRVGVGFSGSFPSLNLAVLSACNAMGVEVCGYASVGASSYGANNPELSFPEMLSLLIAQGLLPPAQYRVTPGGGGDTGGGMDADLLGGIEARLAKMGITLHREPDFAQNLAQRIEYMGEIACFVSVGGNATSLGRREIDKTGVILPSETMATPVEGSGLVEVYHHRGVPVLHLLNIKKLCEEYALPFDPATPTVIGHAEVYFTTRVHRWPLVLSLGAAAGLLLYGRKRGSAAAGADSAG